MLASKLLFLLSSVIAMGTVRGDDRSLGYDAFCSKDSAIIKRPHACFTSKDGPIVPDARIEEPSDHWNFPSTVNTGKPIFFFRRQGWQGEKERLTTFSLNGLGENSLGSGS